MARLLTWAGPPPVAAITGNAPKRAVISGLLPSDRKAARLPDRLPDPRVVVILVTMSETRSLAEAKAHLSELVARAGTEHERITVTVHGRPTAVLLAVEDLEALEETIAVLSDPALLRSLGEADAELARGEGEDQKSLAAGMQARRATA